jgi:hypothetical protein
VRGPKPPPQAWQGEAGSTALVQYGPASPAGMPGRCAIRLVRARGLCLASGPGLYPLSRPRRR